MATTKLWPVRGRIGKLVSYVENPDKTDAALAAASRSLADVLAYAEQPEKTRAGERVFVTGINCDPATAREEMQAVKEQFGKTGGIVACHAYQSFAPGELTPELAHELGTQLARTLWGDRFQVVVATHLDRESHLHNHFLVNSVSFQDGARFRNNIRACRLLRETSDRLCREHGLSVVPDPCRARGRQYGEWRAEQERRPTWRGLVKADIDEALRASFTEQDFFRVLAAKGYEWKQGRDLSVRPPGKERFLRLTRNFGEAYSPESIRRRILENGYRAAPAPKKEPGGLLFPRSNPLGLRPTGGLQGLYLHYCYLLGVFPEKPKGGKLPFALREELRQMERYAAEAQLLAAENIDTLAELAAFRSGTLSEMKTLTGQRQSLRYRLRTLPDGAEKEAARAEATALTKRLALLRSKAAACDAIEKRSVTMAEKLRQIEEEKQDFTDRKEGDRDEHKR